MSYINFITFKPMYTIFNCSSDCTNSKIPIIGVPLEETISFRPGTRFSTQYLRMFSQYFEISPTVELYKNIVDLICDLGDVNLISGNINYNLNVINNCVTELLQKFRKIICIGGEHTISLPIAKAIQRNFKLLDVYVYLDAHLDLRDEWPINQKISHATHVRRIHEEVNPNLIICFGYRAYGLEELDYAKESKNIVIIHEKQLKSLSRHLIRKIVRDYIESYCNSNIHISIDLDVFDPSICPGVSNPEANGLNYDKLYEILEAIIDYTFNKVQIFDVCEYNPVYDVNNVTLSYLVKLIIDIVNLTTD